MQRSSGTRRAFCMDGIAGYNLIEAGIRERKGVCVCVRERERETDRQTDRQIYYKDLAHAVMEAEMFQDLQSAN